MFALRPSFLHGLFILSLTLAALWVPLPLYLFALAVFGLPHVIWEMAFLRSRYAKRWPLYWWYALWLVLLLQASARTALWLGSYSAASSQIVDILTLAILALLLLCAPSGAGWMVRIIGLVFSGILLGLLEQNNILPALLLLAIAHNFTPLAMVWDMARHHQPSSKLAWKMTALFILPLLVAASGWSGIFTSPEFLNYAPLLEGQILASWGGSHHHGFLSAIVLSQCFHYYSVIYLLPRAESQRTSTPLMTATLRNFAITAAFVMLGYYWVDYTSARKFYAIAAGMHAWIEWPILLIALLSISRAENPSFLNQVQ